MRQLLMLVAVCTAVSLLMGPAIVYAQHDDPDMEWGDDELVEEEEDVTPQTLYDRLGGKTGIKGVASELAARILADKRINDHFVEVDPAQLKTDLVEQLTGAAGEEAFTGKSLKQSSLEKGLSERDLKILAEQTQRALDWFDFSYGDKKTLLSKLELIESAETKSSEESM